MIEPIRTVGIWELGRHTTGGWSQWYVRHANAPVIGLVDFEDAAEAGLPDNLHKFTADDVILMRQIVWRDI